MNLFNPFKKTRKLEKRKNIGMDKTMYRLNRHML